MPIHKEGSGFQWGGKGKVYSTRAGAAKQAAAAHANGFSGDKMSKAELLKQVSDAIDSMIASRVAKDGGPGSGPHPGGGKGSSKAEARNIGAGIGKVFKQAESGAKKFPVGSKVKGLSSGDKPGEVIGHSGNMVHTTKGDFHVTKIMHAKDAVSHDPKNGQFVAGGGSGGGKEVGKNALRDTHVNMHNSAAEQHTKQGDHHNAIGNSLKESGNWKGSMPHFQAGAAHHIAATWHKDAAQAHSEGAPDRKKKSSDAAEASNEAVEATRSAQIKDQPSAGKHKP